MNITLNISDPCPCGSDLKVSECCGSNGSRLIRPANLVLAHDQPTGISLAGCYAGSLNDCGGPISGEHVLSDGILREMGGPFAISGVNWLKDGETKTLPASALRSNILCRDHNTFLSPLDARAKQFFGEMVATENHIRSGNEGVRLRLFNGHDLERWLLKVLLGLVASGTADHAAGEQGVQAMDYWVDILFHNKPFPSRLGLYVHSALGTETPADNAAKMALVSNAGDGIYGLTMQLRDKIFMLPLKMSPGPLPPDSLLFQAIYRPKEFVSATGGVAKASCMFTWDNDADSRAIVWDYKEQKKN